MFRAGAGAGKHAGVFTKRPDTLRNGLGVKTILATQLLGAKNTAENDAVGAGGLDRRFHRRRMMREIIDDQNSPDFALHIHSALHAAERRKRFANLRGCDTASLSDNERGHRV